MADADGPVRTCIGCRGRAPRDSLLRFVLAHDADGSPRVVPDPGARLPGRGAWLHDDERCRALATKRRALRRALRTTGDVEVPDLDRADNEDGAGHVTPRPE